MNQLAQELDDKLRSLDPTRARNLEHLVRNAMARVDQEGSSADSSDERTKSLTRLIGIWKTDNPPTTV